VNILHLTSLPPTEGSFRVINYTKDVLQFSHTMNSWYPVIKQVHNSVPTNIQDGKVTTLKPRYIFPTTQMRFLPYTYSLKISKINE